MIIRKPYAFLIRNFKKIHILLLLLSLFVAYKIFDVSNFVNDFMQFGIYDVYTNPITKHISLGLEISIILLLIGSAAILFLLRYKQKQWKLYLIPIAEYAVLIFVLNMIKGIFNMYNTTIKTTDVRLSRDLLIMLAIAQIPAIATFVIRTFGLDKNKFNFKQDEEFLSLSEKDREEVEISFDIDKNSFKRAFKKFKRNIKYFYIEHKKICIGLVVILVAGIGFSIYKTVFVTNRTYSEGELYSANGYTIKVNGAYYTDKNAAGRVITKKSDFVIVNVEVQNNSEPRTIEMENFHLKNSTKDYVSTRKTYTKDFYDFGDTYDIVKELKRDEQTSFIIVFKVDKNLDKDKFVMFYQEDSGYLRKIKINVKDVSKIAKIKELKLGDTMDVDIVSNPDTVSLDFVEIVDSADCIVKICRIDGCTKEEKTLNAPKGSSILRIKFGSEIYGPAKMLNFVKRHGKISYVDEDKVEREVDIVSVADSKYYGKVLYLKVPEEVDENTKIVMDFVIRDKAYKYKLN